MESGLTCDKISYKVKFKIFSEALLESSELAHAIVDVISSKKAGNILMLDMRDLTLLADYYVLCDGSSKRQIGAIGEGLLEDLEDAGPQSATVEGTSESGWMLVDFGSVIVHVFSPEKRAYYQLEELWKEAPVVVRMI